MALGPSYRKLFTASTISNLGDGVSLIAYPWLASAITRSPVLIALVAVAQRLPWLVFTLPAGVITDRNDRRKLMVGANSMRAVLTGVVALAVFMRRDVLPAPDAVEQVMSTEWLLYLVLIAATLLLGVGEVLYDNSAQTFLPAIVETNDLEKANGRLYSAELVANQFAGPPLAGLLLAIGFALPFVVDAGSFAASAVLVFSIAALPRSRPEPAERRPWRVEAAEGFRWLWQHDVIRTLAITLGFLNMLSGVGMAVFVLYGQEVLGTSTTEFAVLSMAAAFGGILGGLVASRVSRRLGSGPSLAVTILGGAVCMILIGLATSWPMAWVFIFAEMFTGVLWNVITVSFRQSIIPDRLLGRVNSVYRFFGWGAMPIGALIGGAIATGLEGPLSRESALRATFVIPGVAQFLLAFYALPRLTTAKMDAARAAVPEPAAPATTPH